MERSETLSGTKRNSDAAVGGGVLLYDGECGFCQRTVRWLLRRDRNKALWFAAQHHPAAQAALARHGLARRNLNAAVLISDFGGAGERATVGADAILAALRLLGWPWKLAAIVGGLVPRALRDLVYRAVARNRLRLFPAPLACELPIGDERQRFLPL